MQDIKVMDLIKPFILEGNDDLPYVRLDKDNNKFEIIGKSLPEDVAEFYTPIIDWFIMYSTNPNEKTTLEIRLEYLNSGSSKMIFTLLQKLQDLHFKGHKVLVRWHYFGEDEDLREEGKGFADKLDMPFELIRYDD